MKRVKTGCGCPVCHSQNTRVHNSRARVWNDITTVFRGRNCGDCGHKWNTYEVPDSMMPDSDENIEAMRDAIRKKLIMELVRQL